MNIDSGAKNTLVGGLLPQTENSWAWIGNQIGTTPEFFLDGRPNGDGDCIRIFSLVWGDQEDKWDDQSCSDSGPYVCEYVPGTFIYVFGYNVCLLFLYL